GAPQPVGRAIVDHLFGDDTNGRIPIVGIAGTSTGAAIARNTAELLGFAGRNVGLANGDGLFVKGRRIAEGDCARWKPARRLLMNRFVDAAVIENGARAIVSEGLAYDRCSVGVVDSLERSACIEAFDI